MTCTLPTQLGRKDDEAQARDEELAWSVNHILLRRARASILPPAISSTFVCRGSCAQSIGTTA